MNQKIEKLICDMVKNHPLRGLPFPFWKEPIVCFSDAKDPLFEEMKKIVRPDHCLPEEMLENANSVISYFIPFEKVVVESNIGKEYSSELWGIGKPETNYLIDTINEEFNSFASGLGFDSTFIPATYNFTASDLKSTWSHKHVGYIAGLGTFGVNNLLITEKGCCGRIGTIVTSIEGIITTERNEEKENCLYKKNKSCLLCVDSCPQNSLSENYDEFKRFKCCVHVVLRNKVKTGYDTCGKCAVGVPCSYKAP